MSKNFIRIFIGICVLLAILQFGAFAENADIIKCEKDGVVTAVKKDTEKLSLFGTYESTLPKLPAPTGLMWNEDDVPGNISWNAVPESEGEYSIVVYRNGQEYYAVNWTGLLPQGSSQRVGIQLSWDILDSGSYTFQITANGDDINNTTSDISSVSAVYVYVKPQTVLGVPSNVKWDAENPTVATWDSVPNAWGYDVEVYKDGEQVGGQSGCLENNRADFLDWMSEPGVYTFKVRAISDNIERIANGSYSVYSVGYNVIDVAEQINNTLSDLVSNYQSGNTNADGVLSSLKTLNTDDLAASMQTNSDVLNNIESLEQAYAAEKNITVTNMVDNAVKDKIDPDRISIVGAALNAAQGVNNMSLHFAPPNEEVVVDDSQYKNVVQIDIKLNGAAVSGNLDVPVRITMPIPTGVSEIRLVILHYHEDGSYETVECQDNFDGTVSFTLTSFSTFAFAETAFDYIMTIDDLTYSNVTGEVTTNVSITNNTDMYNNALLVLAVYNGENNRLINIVTMTVDLRENNTYFEEENFGIETGLSNIKVKVLLWQDGTRMLPLSNPSEQTYLSQGTM